MSVLSAAPFLALLDEPDDALKGYALQSLDQYVDQLWAEIADHIFELESLYEDPSFGNRKLVALVISKIYYNLGDFEQAVKYLLGAEDAFDVEEKTQFAQVMISKCIQSYITLSQARYEQPDSAAPVPEQLALIMDRMLAKCYRKKELKLAIGVALESRRLDVVAHILSKECPDEAAATGLIDYILSCAMTIAHQDFRSSLLSQLAEFILALPAPDYFQLAKITVQLNDAELATRAIMDLLAQAAADESRRELVLIAYQVAFDLVASASQELLLKTAAKLQQDAPSGIVRNRVLRILSGVPTCDLNVTFLQSHNRADMQILNKSKKLLDGRNSVFHNAVTLENAFMHAGTTNNSFFQNSLDWLGNAANWSKFSATAALGVIHKGNLSQGKTVLQPYLPGGSGGHYTQGGSLFALGIVFAGHGKEVTEYLLQHASDDGSAGSAEGEVVLHGACLGLGVAALASNTSAYYEALRTVLYTDSAVAGEAAGIGMGLVMCGSGAESAVSEMLQYAQETAHDKIVRGLAVGLALVMYGKEEKADGLVDSLLAANNPILRYGGAFAVALAYCGTGSDRALKRLLHVAVSDSSDDVRRAAVVGIGFVLVRNPTAAPAIVEPLAVSHNPNVRYGTAMALGIACAGTGLDSAIDVLEPLSKDPVDFVRQGALIALSMVLIQQTEKRDARVKKVREEFRSVIGNKHQDALAKFGAAVAQGIIDAGGRNVTIAVEHHQTGSLNMSGIIGLALFVQYWYWFPLANFLCLSFTPTCVVGLTEDLKAPEFELKCYSKKAFFDYPPKYEETTDKSVEKVVTAVLSTTAKAKARARRVEKEKQAKEEGEKQGEPKDQQGVEKMEVDEQEKPAATAAEGEEAKEEDKEEGTPEDIEPLVESEEAEEDTVVRYSHKPFSLPNMSRVLPSQMKFVAFPKDGRYTSIRRLKGNSNGGVIMLVDKTPGEPVEFIKTIREINGSADEAPLPEPFVYESDGEEE